MTPYRSKVFKLDAPSWLPIAIPLTMTELAAIALFAVVGAQLGRSLGVGGMFVGFLAGAALGVVGVLTLRRSFPGPQPAYFLAWVFNQRSFYEYRPTKPEPPLVVYGKD